MPLIKTLWPVGEQDVTLCCPRVYLWKMEPEESVERLQERAGLSVEEECRLARMVGEKRRKEWLVARVILQEKLPGVGPIVYNPLGAPCVSRGFISVSHTDGYVALAAAENRCGIDAELCARNFERVASKFLNDSELALFRRLDATWYGGLNLFCGVVWSVKEALFKRQGVEGVDFKRDMRVEKVDGTPEKMLIRASFRNEVVHLVGYFLGDVFVIYG